MGRMFTRGAAVLLGGVGLAIVAGVGVASAHIDADPPAVEAGTVATVAFKIGHGCSGSPTTAIDIQVPAGITDAKPVEKEGWTATVEGSVVRFSGGSLGADTPDAFAIIFTAPTSPGTVNFPIVQKCEVGETAWIEVAAEGQPEPEHPAATLEITQGPPTSDDLAGEHGEETTTTVGAAVTTTVVASSGGSDDSNAGLVIGVVIAVVVVVGAGVVLAMRRRSSGS